MNAITQDQLSKAGLRTHIKFLRRSAQDQIENLERRVKELNRLKDTDEAVRQKIATNLNHARYQLMICRDALSRLHAIWLPTAAKRRTARLDAIRETLLPHDSLNPVETDPGELDDEDRRQCWKNELDYREPLVKARIAQLMVESEGLSNKLFFSGASSVNASQADQHAFAAAAGTEMVLGWIIQNWDFIFARLEDC